MSRKHVNKHKKLRTAHILTERKNGRNLQLKETSVVCQVNSGVSRLTLSRGQ